MLDEYGGDVYGRECVWPGEIDIEWCGAGGGDYSVDAGVWAKIAILGADIWESPFMLYLHGYKCILGVMRKMLNEV